MPTYEYKCEDCGEITTRRARMGAADKYTTCDRADCRGRANRVFTTPGVQVEGGYSPNKSSVT